MIGLLGGPERLHLEQYLLAAKGIDVWAHIGAELLFEELATKGETLSKGFGAGYEVVSLESFGFKRHPMAVSVVYGVWDERSRALSPLRLLNHYEQWSDSDITMFMGCNVPPGGVGSGAIGIARDVDRLDDEELTMDLGRQLCRDELLGQGFSGCIVQAVDANGDPVARSLLSTAECGPVIKHRFRPVVDDVLLTIEGSESAHHSVHQRMLERLCELASSRGKVQ